MTVNRKRIPGEKNTGNGASAGLLGLFATLRTRRAKKNAIAAWEAQRRDQQR